MKVIEQTSVQQKIGSFVNEVFFQSASLNQEQVRFNVEVTHERWLMNDHFPGLSIIQCFFQGAMLLFQEHQPEFDARQSLFFLGGVKVKFLRPILLGDTVSFQVDAVKFSNNILLFGGNGVTADGRPYARISGSLSSKERILLNEMKEKRHERD